MRVEHIKSSLADDETSDGNSESSTINADQEGQLRARKAAASKMSLKNESGHVSKSRSSKSKSKKTKDSNGEDERVSSSPSRRSGLRSSLKKQKKDESSRRSGDSSTKKRTKRRNSLGAAACASLVKNQAAVASSSEKKNSTHGKMRRRGSMIGPGDRDSFYQGQLDAAAPYVKNMARSKSHRKKRSNSLAHSSFGKGSTQSPSPKISKSVSFSSDQENLVTHSYEHPHNLEDDEVKELWYDHYDLEAFKHQRDECLEDIISELGDRIEVWRKSLERAYDLSCAADSDDCMHDKSSASYKLVTFRLGDLYAESEHLVGLETLLADDIKSDGNRRRARVLDLMDKLRDEKERRKRLNTSMEGDESADQAKLFEESLEASRASRFFSHGMAVARMSGSRKQ